MDYIRIEKIREIFCRVVRERTAQYDTEDAEAFYCFMAGACDMMDAIEREVGADREPQGKYL